MPVLLNGELTKLNAFDVSDERSDATCGTRQ